MEMKYYKEVVLPGYKSGEIVAFERQKNYILQPGYKHNNKKVLPIEYKADFYIEYKDGSSKVIDIKGFAEATAKLKRKLFWFVYPELDYVWIGWSLIDGGFVEYETIQENRRKRKAERRKGNGEEQCKTKNGISKGARRKGSKKACGEDV